MGLRILHVVRDLKDVDFTLIADHVTDVGRRNERSTVFHSISTIYHTSATLD